MSKSTIVICFLFASSFIYLVNAQVFKDACLKAHNRFRRQHGVPDLVLNAEMQASAIEAARYLASIDKHELLNNRFAQNTYYSTGEDPVTGFIATKSWYDEIKDYEWEDPAFKTVTHQFAQVVWKSTKRLGCAFARNGTKTAVVAYYLPRGNYNGLYKENIPRPLY